MEDRERIRREHLAAGAIYGIVAYLAILVLLEEDHTDPTDAIAILVGSAIVYWLAHVYAHAIAWSLDSNEPFSARELRPIARKEWPLLQAAVVPTIALVAGGIGLIRTQTAYWLAIGYGVAALIWWGLLIARKEGLSRRVTCVVVFANALFGLAIVLLKEFVNH